MTGLTQAATADRQGQTMFAKLRQQRHLKARAEGGVAVVTFAGRTARIARIRHFRQTDSVSPGGPLFSYPEHGLLGISSEDVEVIRDMVLSRLNSPSR
ncbi:phage virion morphogenesis protein [Acidovorax sp. BLS4]|uniref:phage virion morphogenesis protein n=1 Tax=Acidovorax sp. BLS4 TaxID=3273430 RepID=UPI002943F180|nr:phage virion morphogenesis protein [Paracidovorax avenae]WOI45139.1 phage virion morphogenesis protein [Paracidovorax avenae]